MYRLVVVWLILLLLTPLTTQAVENAGIVDGIWLSNPQPVENQPVRIYVAIHNTTSGDLEGTVHFRVNDQLLDTMRINALSGRIIESWADWVPEAGTSTLTVDLRRTELANTAFGTQSVAVVQPLTKRTFYIDTDTDADGLGNRVDDDDDNDGISDRDERSAGTDPLVYNAPPQPEPDVPAEAAFGTATSNNQQPQPTAAAQNEHAGLETLVEASAAQSLLERTTQAINTTKQNLDTYRAERRTTPVATSATSTTTTTSSIDSTLRNLFHLLYTGGLATLSWLLGYPGVVQLLFLLLVLYLLYCLARYFGRRPNN